MKEHKEYEEMYALRCTCQAEEPACCSMLILEPAHSKTSQKLSIRGCKSFVTYILEPVLERLDSTSILLSIDRLDLESWVSQTSCGGKASLMNSSEELLNTIEQVIRKQL